MEKLRIAEPRKKIQPGGIFESADEALFRTPHNCQKIPFQFAIETSNYEYYQLHLALFEEIALLWVSGSIANFEITNQLGKPSLPILGV